MKTNKKALLTVLCALLLVVASVMGTMAYLTATDTVTNTFTVGNVTMTMDEANVDGNGKKIAEGQEGAGRGDANSYKLYPGATYDKDPTLHVKGDASWLIIAVKNPLAGFEAATNKIADQITTKGWNALTVTKPVEGYTMYYKAFDGATTLTDVGVFDTVTIADNAQSVEGWADLNNQQIIVQAYAIQKDGFATAAAAWDATFGK